MSQYRTDVEGQRFNIVDLRRDGTRVRVNDRLVEVDLDATPMLREGEDRFGPMWRVSLLVDGVPHEYLARRSSRGSWEFFASGSIHTAEVRDEGEARAGDTSSAARGPKQPTTLKAPMPGMVVSVLVGVGDLVQPGDPLVVVSAMKMENELQASAPGRVAKVGVVAGEAVNKNQLLVEFDPSDP